MAQQSEGIPIFFVDHLKPKSRLIIIEGFEIQFPRQRPNAWVRFWYRFFLGWRWEALSDEKQTAVRRGIE